MMGKILHEKNYFRDAINSEKKIDEIFNYVIQRYNFIANDATQF